MDIEENFAVLLPVWVLLILLPLRNEDEEGVKNECG